MGVVLLCSLLRLMVKQSQGSAAPRQPCSSRRFSEPSGYRGAPEPSWPADRRGPTWCRGGPAPHPIHIS